MNKIPQVSFQDLLDKFPKIKPPITLAEDSHHAFCNDNDPLPLAYIHQYFTQFEENIDEYTELVPCFQIQGPQQFHALVYWRAKLMNYDYYLITYNLKEEFIERVRIAGTNYKDDKVLISVALIDEDWIIDIVEGIGTTDHEYDPSGSRSYHLELMDSGHILDPNKRI